MNTPRTELVEKEVYPTYFKADNERDELFAACFAWAEHERNGKELETELAEVTKELAALKKDYGVVKSAWRKASEERDALLRGEYICKKCGIRKDGEGEKGDF